MLGLGYHKGRPLTGSVRTEVHPHIWNNQDSSSHLEVTENTVANEIILYEGLGRIPTSHGWASVSLLVDKNDLHIFVSMCFFFWGEIP